MPRMLATLPRFCRMLHGVVDDEACCPGCSDMGAAMGGDMVGAKGCAYCDTFKALL